MKEKSALTKTLFFAAIAAVLGGWLAFSGGTLFVVALSVLIGYALWRNAEAQERVFLLTLFILALGLRYLFIVYYQHLYLASGAFPVLAPDGETLIQRGWYISRVLLHKNILAVPSDEYVMQFNWITKQDFGGKLPYWDQYQVGIYSYYLGIFFALFGYAPAATKCISALSTVGACALSYFIARDVFGKTIAKISYALLLFFPSMFIHSLTNLSDPFLLLFSTLLIWSLVKIARRPRFGLLLLIAVAIVGLYYLKKPVAPLGILIALVSFYSFLPWTAAKKVVIAIVLAGVLLAGVPPLRRGLLNTRFGLDKFLISHRSYTMLKGASYYIFPPRYYGKDVVTVEGITPAETAFAFLKGTVYFLFSPFPFGHSLKAFGIVSSWQNMFWYLLFPFSLVGIIAGLRYKFREAMPIFTYLLVFTLILAVSEGHSATAFRHRDMLMPGFIIFAVAGLAVVFKKTLLYPIRNINTKGA